MSFYHANYPEGVRSKVYSLEMLERGEHLMLARSIEHTPLRLLLIYDITWAWLHSHFGIQPPSESDEISRWLSSHA